MLIQGISLELSSLLTGLGTSFGLYLLADIFVPFSKAPEDRDHENHDDYYSPRRSRSKSRSISPRDERNYRSKGRSSRQSRPMSRSNSPPIQKKRRFSMSPRDNSQIAQDMDSAPRRLESPGRNADSSGRSRSRSYSR